MAGAIIIACGIGILLLILAGYVIVDGTLASANIITSAQKDMVLNKEAQMRTEITVTYADKDDSSGLPPYQLDFDVKNTGNEVVTKLDQVGVVVLPTGSGNPIYYKKGDGNGNTWALDDIYADNNWAPEVVNPDQWDPGEYLYCFINNIPYEPDVIYVFTANGVTDDRTVSW